MHALTVHTLCSFDFLPHVWIHAQKWIGSFHLETEEIAGTKIKFHHHTFHKTNALPEKICFKLWFPRTQIYNQFNICKASIYTESKQSSSRNFKCNNFSYINKKIKSIYFTIYNYLGCCSFWILLASNRNNWLFWVRNYSNIQFCCCLEFSISFFLSSNSSRHNNISFSLSSWSFSAFSRK